MISGGVMWFFAAILMLTVRATYIIIKICRNSTGDGGGQIEQRQQQQQRQQKLFSLANMDSE